jgi:hypothetical protein
MSKTEALTKPFAKSLQDFNTQLLRPQIYISEKSKEILETYKADNCLSYGHVVWITPVTIVTNTINIALTVTSLGISACVAPFFLVTGACASDCDDVSESLMCEATMVIVEATMIRDSIERITRSIIAPVDAALSCNCTDN